MTPNPLPRHLREKVNKLAHQAGVQHGMQLRADLTRRLLDVRTTEGNAALAGAMQRIEQELEAGGAVNL